MKLVYLASIALIFTVGGRAAPAGPHEFLALDEGLGNLLHVNERDASRNWVVPVGRPTPRDMQLIGHGKILIGHDSGYSEFDIVTGKNTKEVAVYKGVTSARRLANGHTLVTGVDLAGSKGVVILDLDATDAIAGRIIYPGNYVRLMRQTAQGTFLLMNDSMIREGDRTGAVLHEWTVPGFRHAWKALRLPNGHLISSAGYGAFLVELDQNGAVLRKFGGKGQVAEAINPNFYATFQILKNGDIVAANWQGHGRNHGASGVQLVEFDPTGAVVWQWSDAKIISSLQGVLVLDGLDTSLLYDERNGPMEPLEKK